MRTDCCGKMVVPSDIKIECEFVKICSTPTDLNLIKKKKSSSMGMPSWLF